jgi:helix-turn-helix protein
MREGEKSFEWDALVSLIVHPTKVAIIEGLWWVGQPLSASDLAKMLGRKYELSNVSYHMGKLADLNALTVVRTRQARGSIETFYFFP